MRYRHRCTFKRVSLRVMRRHFLEYIFDSERWGLPDCYKPTVVVLRDGYLFPYFPAVVTDVDDPTVFKVGTGASGKAVLENRRIAVIGDAVSNSEYGLTLGQQEFFTRYKVVAAVPIRIPSGDVVGSLSVLSEADDDTFGDATGDTLEEDAAWQNLEDLADKICDCLGT